MEVDIDTSAGRLHQVLSRAKEALHQSGPCQLLWARVFEIPFPEGASSLPPQQLFEVISGLIQFHNLVMETESRLRQIEGLKERYFRPFERIRNLASQSMMFLNGDIGSIIQAVSDSDMAILEFAAEKLAERERDPKIDEEELKRILEDVQSLFEYVRITNLESELSVFLLNQLEAIRRGIFEYQIRGPIRLREALAVVVGNLYVNREVLETDSGSEAMGRFKKVFSRFAALVTFMADSTALIESVRGLLPGG